MSPALVTDDLRIFQIVGNSDRRQLCVTPSKDRRRARGAAPRRRAHNRSHPGLKEVFKAAIDKDGAVIAAPVRLDPLH